MSIARIAPRPQHTFLSAFQFDEAIESLAVFDVAVLRVSLKDDATDIVILSG